jgi:RuvB-like protein 1 (pontin 52)
MTLTRRQHSILAKANGRTQIDVQDVAECEDLFLDARRSATLLSSEAGRGFLS